MFEQLLKHLAHCQRLLLDSLGNLQRQSKLGELTQTLTDARTSATDLLKLVPVQQVSNFTDLEAVRQACALCVQRMAEAHKLLDAEAKALAKKKVNPSGYRQVYSMQKLRAFAKSSEQDLQDVQINIDSATNLARDAKQTTPDQRIKIELSQLMSDLGAAKNNVEQRKKLLAEFAEGLEPARILALALGFRGDYKELGLVLTREESQYLLMLIRQRAVQDQDNQQVVREKADLIRTDKQAKYVEGIKKQYAPKLGALAVKEHGIQPVRSPLAVQTVHPMGKALWSKYGIKSEPFGYEKFTNNTYLIHDQLLLVFRKSDAKAFNADKLATELDTSSQQQLKAARSALNKIDKQIGDAEGAEHKRLTQQYQKLEARVADLKAQSDLERAHAKTRNKTRKSSPDEEVLDYAYHMLDLVNERSQIEYELVTAKFVRSVGNHTNYLAMWVLPKNVVRALRGTIGVTHDFCKSVKLPWL